MCFLGRLVGPAKSCIFGDRKNENENGDDDDDDDEDEDEDDEDEDEDEGEGEGEGEDKDKDNCSSWTEVPLSLNSLGSFLRLSAGISAWKSYDGVHAPHVQTQSGLGKQDKMDRIAWKNVMRKHLRHTKGTRNLSFLRETHFWDWFLFLDHSIMAFGD